MDKKATIRNSEREIALKLWINEEIIKKGAKLPVMPEEVYEALEKINISNAINELALDIPLVIDFVNKKNVQAIVYNWFYDGGEENDIYADDVSAYGACDFDGKPGNIDLIKLPNNEGLEMDIKFENRINNDAIDGFCLDPVMNNLYGQFLPKWRELFDDFYEINEELDIDVDLDDVTVAYEELFHLKLISILREAYFTSFNDNLVKITTGNPFHIFIKRHGRWPMHVLSLNI